MTLKSITQRLFGTVLIDFLRVCRNAWYIDGEKVTASADMLNATEPGPKSVTAAKLGPDVAGYTLTGGNGLPLNLKASLYKVGSAAGTNVGVNVTFNGIRPTDYLAGVYSFTMAGVIVERTSEYTPGTNILIKTAGTNETGKYLRIHWIDLTP